MIRDDNLIDVVYDADETDLEAVMKPWEAEALRYIWSREGKVVLNSEVWKHVSKLHSISRTSIRKFLKRMTNRGVLINERKTGRGGIQGRYYARLDESDFKKRIIQTILTKLLDHFPQVAWEAIGEQIQEHQTDI